VGSREFVNIQPSKGAGSGDVSSPLLYGSHLSRTNLGDGDQSLIQTVKKSSDYGSSHVAASGTK